MAEVLCGKCNETVTGRIITALNKSWHPDHFVCLKCDKPISGSTFNERDGSPICSDCFLQYFSEICASCKKPIKGKIIKALGQTWHEDHFVCGGPCMKPMSGESFFERDGKPYCREDFENIFAAKCKGCEKPISDKAIVALEAKWHKDCFKCKACQEPITANTFAVEDNQPLCTSCA
ncbi:hypothetical protein HA402_009044 [Bradysia odoriphaga]|nr:hypothetical protein HA402_009044 [Bradysia odoriphaga]